MRIRGDSAFAREALMAWCETHRVDDVLGLALNSRLIGENKNRHGLAEVEHENTGRPCSASRISAIGGGIGAYPSFDRHCDRALS